MYSNTQELIHFGVKGMKWGIRRYENYDGTYTKAGLKRYKQTYKERKLLKGTIDTNSKKDKSFKKTAFGKSLGGSLKAYNRQLRGDWKDLKKSYHERNQKHDNFRCCKIK